jgi:maltose alpha-D-glucosyltransferase/alpha-amylase
MLETRDHGVGLPEDETTWYKDALIYQLHVRAYCDSDGDGGGDVRGLASKLDHIRDLGMTAIWVLPFYPSPLRDDGYDIADYTGVHPAYGTLGDFKLFLREAHRRGLRVITELVLNHTSDQHPWFQRARRARPGSPWRNFYVWSDTADSFKDARIIFKDFESSNWTWDPVAGAYYWHRFYSHQPDLNYDNPAIHRAVRRVVDFWLGLGVDGLRLDAVPYLYQREGTNCENLPETHAALKQLRAHVDAKFRNRVLLAEANQWPEDAVAYFGDDDECHMAFHFPLMPRMFMALRIEDRYPIIDILAQTPPIPPGAQWAVFLRNHDELTLEMVTDEERDYMYRTYAADGQARINLGIRRRLAPLLDHDRRRIELMNGLLFSLPGTPVVYYGDEIGMGDNIYLGDRNGVRTPMQWNADRNAGFSSANPQRLYLPVIIDPDCSYEAINAQTQLDSPHSLLWWMRRLIAQRRRFKAFGRGSLEFLYPANGKVLAFVRRHEEEEILVVGNLSRYSQYVELDLSSFKERIPVEVFGQTDFPRIGELPYLLTLGPYAFHWFSLEARPLEAFDVTQVDAGETPTLSVRGSWEAVFRGRARASLEAALPRFLRAHRWFGGKARRIKEAELIDAVPLRHGTSLSYVLLIRVDYAEGDPDTYTLPLAYAGADGARQLRGTLGHTVVVNLLVDGEDGLLYGAVRDRGFSLTLLDAIARRRRFKGALGEIVATPTRRFRRLRDASAEPLEPSLMQAEQTNSSILFGDRMILKLFRRVEGGSHPELEIGSFLMDKTSFDHLPPVLGSLEYRPLRGEPLSIGVLQGFVGNEADAWIYTQDHVERYFEEVLTRRAELGQPPTLDASLLDLTETEISPLAHELIGAYLEAARLLGQRTGELHVALASKPEDPEFAPEPFSLFYQRSLYQSLRNLTEQTFGLLRGRLRELGDDVRGDAERAAARKPAMLRRFRSILDRKIQAKRTRVHGDYHLGQVLWTGRDFVILDFEGEPARPLSTRRLKRSPLRDVAGMIRSFHYAAYHGLGTHAAKGGVAEEDRVALGPWAFNWYLWSASTFLRAYLVTTQESDVLPPERAGLEGLLLVYLLEKAVYELGYELNNRPQWVHLPLHGILQLMETAEGGGVGERDTIRS